MIFDWQESSSLSFVICLVYNREQWARITRINGLLMSFTDRSISAWSNNVITDSVVSKFRAMFGCVITGRPVQSEFQQGGWLIFLFLFTETISWLEQVSFKPSRCRTDQPYRRFPYESSTWGFWCLCAFLVVCRSHLNYGMVVLIHQA